MYKYAGGYAIVDFGGTAITTSGITVDGLYDAISQAVKYNKPVMACGLVLDSIGAVPACFPIVTVITDGFLIGTFTNGTLTSRVTVDDDDTATLVSVDSTSN